MDDYNFGKLLEKSRRENAIKAAKEVSEYCQSCKECVECIFLDKITAECIFTKHNKYGFHKTPEDWEV